MKGKFGLLTFVVQVTAPINWSDEQSRQWLDANEDDFLELVRSAVQKYTNADINVDII